MTMAESKYHRKFDVDYKRKIVLLVEEMGKSPKQVAEDEGGSQYASYDFQDLLREHKVRQSMSAKGLL